MKTLLAIVLTFGLTSTAHAQNYSTPAYTSPTYGSSPSVTMNQPQFDALLAKVAPRPAITKTVVQKYVPTEVEIREAQQYRDKTDFAFWGLIVLLVCAISGLFWALALRLVQSHGAGVATAPGPVTPVIIRPEVVRVTDRTFIVVPAEREDAATPPAAPSTS